MCSSRVQASFSLVLKKGHFSANIVSKLALQSFPSLFKQPEADMPVGCWGTMASMSTLHRSWLKSPHSVQIHTTTTFTAFNSKARKVDSDLVHRWHLPALKRDVFLMGKWLKERTHMPSTEPHLTHADLHNRFFTTAPAAHSPCKPHQSTAAATQTA